MVRIRPDPDPQQWWVPSLSSVVNYQCTCLYTGTWLKKDKTSVRYLWGTRFFLPFIVIFLWQRNTAAILKNLLSPYRIFPTWLFTSILLFFILSFSRRLIFRNWSFSSDQVLCSSGSLVQMSSKRFRILRIRGPHGPLILDLGTHGYGSLITGHKAILSLSSALKILRGSTSPVLHRFLLIPSSCRLVLFWHRVLNPLY